jgi:AP-4 complex subunit epsilon-1
VCSALTVVTRLIGPDMVAAVAGPVVALLAHPREIVRKKAVSVLHRFEQLVPTLEGPLGESDIESHLRRMLCDKAR